MQRILFAQVIQAKLKMSTPGDEYEQEADRVAETVMKMGGASRTENVRVRTLAADGKLQRMCAGCEEEEEDETLQAKEMPGHQVELTSRLHAQLGGLRGGGQPLSRTERQFFEPRFGQDFSRVRLHANGRVAESARSLNAFAYTIGPNIVFSAGQYQPATAAGRALMAHELTHVVQQSRGATRAIVQRKNRAGEVEKHLSFLSPNAGKALDLLSGMDATDFNDTINGMIASRTFRRLIKFLPTREDMVRFLKLLGIKGTQATKAAAFAAEPLFNLAEENSLIVFGQKFGSSWGPKGAAPSSSLKSLVSSDPGAQFSGTGPVGKSQQDAPMSLWDMYWLKDERDVIKEKVTKAGGTTKQVQDAIESLKYKRTPGFERIYDWSNPIKGGLVGPGSYLETLTPTEREGQAKLLFGQEINTTSPGAYGGTLPRRTQIIRAAAAEHWLEPELVAGIILAEQRDQSLREDAADYRGATIGHANTSIGLGQVTIKTAREQNLFADLLSPEFQKRLAMGTNFTNNIIAALLTSDEFNIFAVARYLRMVANMGSMRDINEPTLTNTKAWVGPIDLALYGQDSSKWTPEHIKLMGSEYTSKPFDDKLSAWGDFVLAAYNDVKASKIF